MKVNRFDFSEKAVRSPADEADRLRKEFGVITVEIEFDGRIGIFESIIAFDRNGLLVYLTQPLRERLNAMGCALLDDHLPGWETEARSYGDVKIDLWSKVVVFDRLWRTASGWTDDTLEEKLVRSLSERF